MPQLEIGSLRGVFPLSVGRLFALGWSIFRLAWRKMLGAALVCFVPAYGLMTLVAGAFSPSVNEWLAATQRAVRAGLPTPETPPGFDVAVISLIAASIVLFLASLLAVAANVRIVAAELRGERIEMLDAVRKALGRLTSLVAGQLLYLIAGFLVLLVGFSIAVVLALGGGATAFLALVVLVGAFAGLLFMAVRTSLLAQAVVIEGLGGAEGFGRSWRLVSGSGWRVLGYVLLLALLGALFGLIVGGLPSAMLGLTGETNASVAAATIIDGIVNVLLAPLAPTVLTLLYFDLRWRGGELREDPQA